jgi:hypothetical protein
MCRLDLLEKALEGKANVVVHPIPGADHTLETAQREPRQREKHFHELADVVNHWLARAGGARRRRR